MAETTNYQCPNCGGALYFDGKINRLQCPFCESTFTADEVERIYAERQARADEKAREREEHLDAAEKAHEDEGGKIHVKPTDETDPVQAYLHYQRLDDEESLRAYNCSSCGAQLLVDQVTAVTSCPYCGNNAVLPGQLAGTLKPDYVLPFRKTKQEAIDALARYYGDKKFLPDDFTANNHIEEVQGVYVPFWLFSGVAFGPADYDATRVTTWQDRKNIYTRTDHYVAHRNGRLDFQRVPVDGSTRMPDTHMDAIEPYDYSELTPFSVAYLPGYITDRYDLDAADCEERASTRVETTYLSELQRTVTGYGTVVRSKADPAVKWKDVSYTLLPVWMLHTRWNDNDYLFAMNGQTGKLIGDLPIDNGKATRHFLTLFVPTLVIAVLLVVFVFGGYTM